MTNAIVASPMCFYHLPGGMILFSEGVDTSGKEVTFDLTHTAVVQFVMGPNGQSGIQAIKASESPLALFGGQFTVPKESIIGIQNTKNLDLLANARQAISGIQIAKGPRR